MPCDVSVRKTCGRLALPALALCHLLGTVSVLVYFLHKGVRWGLWSSKNLKIVFQFEKDRKRKLKAKAGTPSLDFETVRRFKTCPTSIIWDVLFYNLFKRRFYCAGTANKVTEKKVVFQIS